jgi:ABC-2 type transport system permease protein
MLGRTLAVTRKEFLHIVRDRRTLVVVILIPIVQMVLLGYAATNDIEHLRLAILDSDETQASRELIDAYRATGYFEIEGDLYASDQGELANMIDGGDARSGLIIPAGYASELATGNTAQVAVVIDGSDPAVANTVYAASQAVGQAKSLELALETMGVDSLPGPQVEVRPRVWYNPELRSANYMIPALMGIVLQFLATLLTALAIVRERELGTMEQLIVTPVRPLELVVGKVTPYVVVAFVVLIEVIVVGVLWFNVPIHGSLILLLSLSALFLVTALSMGILVSTIADTQQEAMLLSWFILLPAIFLSGFFFPLDAMPAFLRAISLGVPLRYLLTILRGIVLKGVGIEMLWPQVAALIVFAVAILLLAALRFKKRLE